MASDDDTTQDPLFKNVPRRPRSAASWPPRKEEPDGGDSGGISVSSDASPPASNKRPASSTGGGGGGGEHVPRAKKHRLVPMEESKNHRHRLVPMEESKNHRHRLVPIKEPEPEDAKDGGVFGGLTLALSHKDKAAAAAAAASSASSSEAEPAVDWAENERCRKGKTPAVNEDDDARTAVARRPLAGSGLGNGKLLGDAIRSHGSTAVAGSFKPPSRTTKPEKPRTKPKRPNKARSKPKNKPMKKDSGAWFWCGTGKDGVSSAGSDADYSFDRIGVVSDRLRTTLRGLGVAAPVRLYGKLLTGCDRDNQQTRLLMSCKKWRAEDAEFPLFTFLTEEEKEAAQGKGLSLTAYDRGGDAYELLFRFLECNFAGRLIRKWGNFLKHNGLDVAKDEEVPVGDDVMLDLWMFRTPGGKAGMVMLHYRRGDAAHADAALDEVEQKRLQQQNNGAAAADADAVMEDIVGDANEEAGVNGELAAAAPGPSSPSEPSGGGGAIEAAEAGGAPGEVAAASSPSEPVADAPLTSSELHGGDGQSDEMTAPLSLGGGDGTEKLQAEAGGALMVMVLEVEVATRSSLGSNAGGAANEVAAPPSSPEQAGGGAAMMATEDEDEVAAEATSDEDEADAGAAARSWNVTEYEFRAAQALMMISRANSDS